MGWKTTALGCLMALLWTGAAQAEDQAPDSRTYEGRAVGAFLTYCVPPVMAGDSVARVASEIGKFPELPPPAQTAFLKGQPGKVFALPQVGPGIVLTAPQSPMCSVIIQTVDAGEFLKQTDFWFDPEHSPFTRTVDQTAANGDIHREYTGTSKAEGFCCSSTSGRSRSRAESRRCSPPGARSRRTLAREDAPGDPHRRTRVASARPGGNARARSRQA